MANQTITQLPLAGALAGTEAVPIVQDGQTVQTTVGAIAAVPVTNYSFLTANSEPLLTDSRQLTVSGSGISLVDNGAGSTLVLSLSGAAASLVAAGTGIQVKTNSTTLTARSIAAGTTGLSVTDGDGVAGSPTILLSGIVLNLANTSGNGLLSRTAAGGVGVLTLTGTASEIDVTDGDGVGGNPTIGIADDPVLPGTGGVVFPKGVTIDRLSPPVEGAFRYNTQTGLFEGYTGLGWGAVITGTGVASFSAGTTGLTPSVPTTGAIVLGGTLISSNGGTGLASYTAGDTLYYASGTALSKLAIGVAARIMTSSGTAPQWTDPATITVGTATTATNLGGGAAGSLPYQTGAGATTFLSIGTATQILKVNAGATALEYADQSTLAVGTATNLAGGAAGSLPYQTGAGTTTFLGIGTASQVLKVNAGATALEYINQSSLAVGTATNLAGGTANQIAVQSNVGATTFITAPTVASTVLSWNGAAFTWATPAAGTVTAVTASSPLASSGGTTPDISLGTVTTANGGTGLTTYTAGDLVYYASGTALSKLGIGTSTYILTSSGTAPQYTDPATITVGTATTATTATNVAGGAANRLVFNTGAGATSFAVAPTVANTFLEWSGSAFQWSSNPLGTVTSVGASFTGGIVSISGSPITTSGTLGFTVAGTSGGIPYFSSSSGWASSGVLASNALVVGGGAGATPATITTGTGVVTALGINTGTAGAFVVNGGALGTPASGTVTNLTGTASININGTVGATTPTTGAFTTVAASGQITSTVATGSAPFVVASTTQVANLNAATAGTATNVAGGAAGSLVYQTGAATTSTLALGTQGYVLRAGASAPEWAVIDGGTF